MHDVRSGGGRLRADGFFGLCGSEVQCFLLSFERGCGFQDSILRGGFTLDTKAQGERTRWGGARRFGRDGRGVAVGDDDDELTNGCEKSLFGTVVSVDFRQMSRASTHNLCPTTK